MPVTHYKQPAHSVEWLTSGKASSHRNHVTTDNQSLASSSQSAWKTDVKTMVLCVSLFYIFCPYWHMLMVGDGEFFLKALQHQILPLCVMLCYIKVKKWRRRLAGLVWKRVHLKLDKIVWAPHLMGTKPEFKTLDDDGDGNLYFISLYLRWCFSNFLSDYCQ